MNRVIRAPKDFWSGVVFILIGIASFVFSRDLAMGTAGNMGPAYFPTILGGLLVLLGIASVCRSFVMSGTPVHGLAIRQCVLVLLSTVAFGFFVRGAGLAVSTVLVVMLSGLASIKFGWRPFLALGVGLAAFGVIVFVYVLGLPMPMFGPWLGF